MTPERVVEEFIAAWRAYRMDATPASEAAAQNAEWLLYKRDGGDAVIAAKATAEQLAGTP